MSPVREYALQMSAFRKEKAASMALSASSGNSATSFAAGSSPSKYLWIAESALSGTSQEHWLLNAYSLSTQAINSGSCLSLRALGGMFRFEMADRTVHIIGPLYFS